MRDVMRSTMRAFLRDVGFSFFCFTSEWRNMIRKRCSARKCSFGIFWTHVVDALSLLACRRLSVREERRAELLMGRID
jgi:hypothetical protein